MDGVPDAPADIGPGKNSVGNEEYLKQGSDKPAEPAKARIGERVGFSGELIPRAAQFQAKGSNPFGRARERRVQRRLQSKGPQYECRLIHAKAGDFGGSSAKADVHLEEEKLGAAFGLEQIEMKGTDDLLGLGKALDGLGEHCWQLGLNDGGRESLALPLGAKKAHGEHFSAEAAYGVKNIVGPIAKGLHSQRVCPLITGQLCLQDLTRGIDGGL